MNRILLFSILGIFFFLGYNAKAATCPVNKDSCESYLCQEDLRGCGKKSYLLNYGHHFCKKFQKLENVPELGAKGKKWIQITRVCLGEALNDLSLDTSCSRLTRFAFKSHVPCYVNAGFCELSRSDQYKVVKNIGGGIFQSRSIKAGIEIFNQCTRNYTSRQ